MELMHHPFPLGEDRDGLDDMFVHRVVMVHVELHHADDASKGRDEAGQHARLAHSTQRTLGIGAAGQQFEEDAVRFGADTQRVIDHRQRRADEAQRIWMQVGVGVFGLREKADQVDGIALEHFLVGAIGGIATGVVFALAALGVLYAAWTHEPEAK